LVVEVEEVALKERDRAARVETLKFGAMDLLSAVKVVRRDRSTVGAEVGDLRSRSWKN
jgi:hypothetical protein